MIKYGLTLFTAVMVLSSCENENSQGNSENVINENAATFKEIGTITIGATGAAEISAYDEVSKKLFTVNNSGTNKIDVIDLSNPSTPVLLASIDLVTYNGAANSVATFNGKLAVAMESTVSKQDSGKVLVFDTTTYSLIKQITVGALPDMITFSADGKFILTANEGEPNDDYSKDPDGTVSIIEVSNNYAVTTLDFSSFSSQLSTLKANGFRIASFMNYSERFVIIIIIIPSS